MSNVDLKLINTAVHRDSEIMGGELVFVGTRVPVSTLFVYMKKGYPLSTFLAHFPSVTREQAEMTLELAMSHLLTTEA